MNLQMLDESEVITKTAYEHHLFSIHYSLTIFCSEFARVFGVDFFSVISRGSQFKVESFMARIAKPGCSIPSSYIRLPCLTVNQKVSLCYRRASKTYVSNGHATDELFIYPFRSESKTQPNACHL